jgi:murein DD-endopeptidase MepM/ murein hydrolase activator NlpD
LDFVSKNATSVLASRTGIVTIIANGGKWDKWCQSSQDCSDKGQIWNGNHISIQHSDGTIAKYLHFKAGSINKSLKVGSKVNQGDFLGIIGSTGYTCLTPACNEPDIHLHFEVQSNTKKETIPTPFYECNQKVNKCTKDGWLIQDNNYFN